MGTDKSEVHHFLNNIAIENLLYTILIAFLPLILVIGGVLVLVAKIPGWSLILGLPMIIIGVTFLIYAYDEAVTRRLEIKYRVQDKFSDKKKV